MISRTEQARMRDELHKTDKFYARIVVVLAAVLRGIGTYCFISPNGFAVGGIAGAAVILEYITGINLGYFNIAMNVPLLILAFFFLSKRYFFATASFPSVMVSGRPLSRVNSMSESMSTSAAIFPSRVSS